MAGKRHQFIVGLLIKQMRYFGCRIKYVDGAFLGGDKLNLPPNVLRHRPDILGVTSEGQICIGEAKTEGDINTKHFREQIEDFTKLSLNGMKCEVFFGIPSLAEQELEMVLKEMGLRDYDHLHILLVPEEIINE